MNHLSPAASLGLWKAPTFRMQVDRNTKADLRSKLGDSQFTLIIDLPIIYYYIVIYWWTQVMAIHRFYNYGVIISPPSHWKQWSFRNFGVSRASTESSILLEWELPSKQSTLVLETVKSLQILVDKSRVSINGIGLCQLCPTTSMSGIQFQSLDKISIRQIRQLCLSCT